MNHLIHTSEKGKRNKWLVNHVKTIAGVPFLLSLWIVVALVFLYNSNEEKFFDIEPLQMFFLWICPVVHIVFSSIYLIAYFSIEAPITLLPFEEEVELPTSNMSDDGEETVEPYNVRLSDWPKPELEESIWIETLQEAVNSPRAWFVVFLWVVSVCGYIEIFMHALILTDFFNTPSGLLVVKAVAVGAPKLKNSFFMGVIMLLIWTMWSFWFYQDEINSIGNPCATVYQCTYKAMQVGFRGDLDTIHGDDHGNIRGGYSPPAAFFEDGKWQAQVIGVLLFYFMWTFILEGIIQGQIIDAFAEMRGEDDAKEQDEKVNCMVCSLSRFAIESQGGQFTEHTSRTHSPQHYLFYIMYVQSRSPTDDTGVMSELREKLQKFDHTFLPIETCVMLNPDEREVSITNSDLDSKMDYISSMLANIESGMASMSNGEFTTSAEVGSGGDGARLTSIEAQIGRQGDLLERLAGRLGVDV